MKRNGRWMLLAGMVFTATIIFAIGLWLWNALAVHTGSGPASSRSTADVRNERAGTIDQSSRPQRAITRESGMAPSISSKTASPEDAAFKLWREVISATPEAQPQYIDLLKRTLGEWLQNDGPRAVAWAQSLPAGSMRTEIVAQLSYELRRDVGIRAASDPENAAAWLRHFPQGDVVESSLASVAKAWAAKDPHAAASYASSLSLEGARNQAANAVATAWGSRQPDEAATWVGQLPEGAMRENAMKGLITAWTFLGDPNEAAEWLEQQPQTRSLDVAINTFSAAVAPKDPEAAFQWASTISDETLRNGQLAEVARTWLTLDAKAARARIVQSSLPSEIKNQLLTNVIP